MKLHTAVLAGLLGASLLGATASAQEQESVTGESIETVNYMNGGMSRDDQLRMQRFAREYSLRMSFSERIDEALLADIPVLITDGTGDPVFVLDRAGPLLHVALPPGTYRVAASFKGLTEIHSITISGKEGKELRFRWQGASKS